MYFGSLLWLAIALFTGWLSIQFTDEIGPLFNLFALLSLLLSIALAPWPIQLLILLWYFR